MKTLQVDDAAGNLDALDADENQPVLVMRGERSIGVYLPLNDVTTLRRDLEDFLWAAASERAHEEGYIGKMASRVLMDELLDAGD